MRAIRADLDRPAQDYLQGHIEWPDDKRAITTRMLLNHTPGLMGEAPCLNNQR